MSCIQPAEETAKDLKAYLNSTYGKCKVYDPKKKHSCNCLDPKVGSNYIPMNMCPNWEPYNVSTWEELKEVLKEMYK